MKILYAPWRDNYTSSVAHSKDSDTPEHECVFCNHFKDTKDEQHFILRRFDHTVAILNRYPYNAGHMMLLPRRHVESLDKLSSKERAELMELTSQSVEILKKALKAEGLNVGINLGKAAGAGIPSHLHVHILPRWTGDTNFVPAIGETKVISFDLTEIFNKLKPEFDALKVS